MAAAWNRAAKFRLALSRPAREALDARGRFKSSFRTWPLCRTSGNELGRHQRQLHSLPDNFELWRPPANNSEDEFVAKYTVNGMTFWDNNTGANTARPITVKRCAPLAISSEISLRRGTCSSIDPPIAAAVNSVRVARRSSDLIVRCRPTAGAARWSPFSYSVGPP
jgi:hypothetical protein